LPVAEIQPAANRAGSRIALAHHSVVPALPDLVFVERPAGKILLSIHLFI
jgi:hypothetical protein